MKPSDQSVPPYPVEPLQARLLRLLYRMAKRNPAVDGCLTSFLRYRNYLPKVSADEIIPQFRESPVVVRDFPRGAWATPIIDTLTVIKAAVGFQSKKVLEIGSYKGNTAKFIAENTPETTRICTLDHFPDHGEAYRGTPLEARIDRIVGKPTVEQLAPHGPFDFIFVDADHDYESVYRHSVCALQLLAPGGVILWHDYQLVSYFHGMGGVPEALHVLARETRRSLLSIDGTILAIYSEYPGWETSRFGKQQDTSGLADPWKDNKIR